MKKLFVTPVLWLLAVGAAQAVPIQYNYTTNTASSAGNVPELIAQFAGLSVSGSFVYDSDAPRTFTAPDGNDIHLGAVTDWTGTVGSNSFSDADNSSVAIIGDETFSTGFDFFLFSMGAPGTGSASGFSIGGFTLDNVRMFWIETLILGTPDFVSGPGLLDPIPTLPGRLALDFGTITTPDDRVLPVNVFFDNLQVTRVPEPASLLLLLSGLLAIGARGRVR